MDGMSVPPMKPTFEELGEQIDEELSKWHSSGIDPAQVGINGLMLDQQVQAIMQILCDKDYITRSELDYVYREKILAKLRELRKQIAPQIARAKLMEGIKPLWGPNGQPLN
jgi:hypothetical protein